MYNTLPTPKAQGVSGRLGQKDGKSKRAKKSAVSLHLVDMTGVGAQSKNGVECL